LVAADMARQLASDPFISFVDDVTQGHHGRSFHGLPVFERMEELATISAEGECEIDIAIGDCAIRVHLAAEANALGFRPCGVVDPRTVVAV
jgi:hypothetical protein